jgi:hypothetical protein
MRNSIWLWFAAFTVPMALGLPALSDEYDELPAKPHLTATLVARLKANPCEVLEEIFRATTDSQINLFQVARGPTGTCSSISR